MNPVAETIGFFAAFMATVAMAPQVIKIHKTKNTGDLSLGAFAMLLCALFLWFVYGLLIGSAPMAVGNVLSFLLTLYIVVMKIRHG